MSHQMMGYDRTSLMFSPDGRLLQVEYAKEAVKQGSTAIGIVCRDGVLLVADKRISDKLVVSNSIEKIFQVDEHIGATATGFVMDGRVLIERARVLAQQHTVTYGVPIEVPTLVKEISDVKQFYTQYGGARPFGVSILFIGVDEEPVLYVTDPTGIFFEYRATAVGEDEIEVKSILNKAYKENMTIEEGLKMAIGALKKVLGKDFDIKRIDAAYIKKSDKKFTKADRKLLK
ncbi:MAG: archaeal proteasome endopeptidase complex subunit alpha [Nanoarchaeota archaeon]|nr:archaeal proteasome endopeptidase complex subunit alpha [Nanoarchaeota archaeon]MBU4241834.1 archaeal proteasome endopeptidase complex subunit alpha [Nanoarchaeota archaeon]MBU4352413.1 archaeal proteasome endopeptidase complex subunit alpha [Nanoarchaeota archaeon]MBU4456060.1 archaeal proteasome endopeptidase complex subunit alpha [Nanoarchaeota archaeon]